jgi:ribonucleoside-diphosphate reductase beta chain
VPEEIDVTKDKVDFKNMSDFEKHIFLSNIKYQIVLDSIQGRAPAIAFAPFVSLPEIEVNLGPWIFFEQIHSRSYTHIIRNMFPNPDEVFNTILDIDEIKKRAKSTTSAYDDFIQYGEAYRVVERVFDIPERKEKEFFIVDDMGNQVSLGKFSKKTLYRKFFLALINVYILEGMRFYNSFVCTWAFDKQKPPKIEGVAKIITKIAADEFQHLGITANIIKNYQKKEQDPLMIEVMNECEEEVYKLFDLAVTEEKEWANYLFKFGSLMGLNATILGQYTEFNANKRLKSIGYKTVYAQKENPIKWTEDYTGNEEHGTAFKAPQETELTQYLVGAVDMTVDMDDIDF